MTYFVRRFKPKLLVFITTGMFNLLSKILESDPPKRDPFGSRPILLSVSSNLCADLLSALLSHQRFAVVSAFPSLPFLSVSVNLFVFTLLPSHSSPWIVVATRQAIFRGTVKCGSREIAAAQT